MYCMKCGQEIMGSQVFCNDCLAAMKQFPVAPGTPVQLPNRPAAWAAKKAAPKKKALSPEEQVRRLQKLLKWLCLTVAALILALVFTVSALVSALSAPAPDPNIGKNYSTYNTTDNT